MDTKFYVAVIHFAGAEETHYENFAQAESVAYALGSRTDVLKVNVYDGQERLLMSYSKDTLTWERFKENFEVKIQDFDLPHVEFDLKERTLEYYFGKGVLSRLVNNDERLKDSTALASTAQTLRAPFQSSPSYHQPSLGNDIVSTGSVKTGGYIHGSNPNVGASTGQALSFKSIIPEQDKLLKKLVSLGEITREHNPHPTITSLAREFAEAFPRYEAGINSLYASLHYLRDFNPTKKEIQDFMTANIIPLSSGAKVSFIRYIERNPEKYETINNYLNRFIDQLNERNNTTVS